MSMMMMSYDSDDDDDTRRPPPSPPSITSSDDGDFAENQAPSSTTSSYFSCQADKNSSFASVEEWWDGKQQQSQHKQCRRLTWNRRVLCILLVTLFVALVFSLATIFAVRKRHVVLQQQATVAVNETTTTTADLLLPTDLPPSSLLLTAAPSIIPSDMPSQVPSVVPTVVPTAMPTLPFIASHEIPSNPPPGYFNYNPNSEYGPPQWHLVDTSDTWLREFGKDGWGAWRKHVDDKQAPLTQNLCLAKGKQSPKDLIGTAECAATHEIRSRCGQDSLSGEAYSKQILPHALRIQAKGRPCLNVQENGMGIDDCRNNQPPTVDYPNYSSQGSDYSDMHHLDIKVPGEHTINGTTTFDAEIQMFHVHLEDGRLSSIGIPIKASSNASTNEQFQWILDEFQYVYDVNAKTCGATNLRGNHSTTDDTVAITKQSTTTPASKKFNPYTFLQKSMWFYRYDGSITEPPCRDITWWVMQEPLEISLKQLYQLQTLLFTNVSPDANCQPTSVHYDMSSARPIQPLGDGKTIQECGAGSFTSDVDKGRPAANQCRDG